MTVPLSKPTVVVCDTQPATAEGLRAVLSACPDLEFVRSVQSLPAGLEAVRSLRPAVVIADKAFGAHALFEWLVEIRSFSRTAPVVWGISIAETEALRFIQAGAKGVIRKCADLSTILVCLRTVAGGATWMEEAIFRESPRGGRNSHSELTARELQVLELVEQGLKNNEIAHELGIRPGTVKIHLKHIFEKTGIRGRYGLALSGLREKGMQTMQEV